VYTALHTDEPSRGERVFVELKSRLIAGDFPLGARLGEERLAGLLDVSRTPVREALLRLHAEGLVARHPDGGFVPVAPDVTAMRECYEVRVALEVQALRRPGRLGTRHDAGQVEQLREHWWAFQAEQPAAGTDFVVVDESFHLALAAAAGNAVLVELLRSVNERIRIVRMQDFTTDDRIEQTITQHLEIAEAVLMEQVDLAVARFEEHLAESLAVVEQRTLLAISRMTGRSAQSA
jgi:DNA-binding GntR family transcriptional regulator